jgi:hypothetical protein
MGREDVMMELEEGAKADAPDARVASKKAVFIVNCESKVD